MNKTNRQRQITLIVLALAVAIGSTAFAGNVKGYTKKNGTYVTPHKRTAPDKSKANNYGPSKKK
jgi:NAD/NADP transhydrogenase beta subunit